jgi:hypothetical protein
MARILDHCIVLRWRDNCNRCTGIMLVKMITIAALQLVAAALQLVTSFDCVDIVQDLVEKRGHREKRSAQRIHAQELTNKEYITMYILVFYLLFLFSSNMQLVSTKLNHLSIPSRML